MRVNRKVLEWHFISWVSLVLIMPLIPIHKLIFSSIFLVYIVICLVRGRTSFSVKTNAPFIIAFIFIYGAFIASFDKFDFGISIQLVSSVAVLFLFYIIYDSGINYNKVILISAYIFSVISIWLGVEGYFLGGGSVTDIVSPYNLLSLDERDIGFGNVLYSRLISLPVVFVAFAQLLFDAKFKKRMNYVGLIVFSIVIIISLTRALIFCWFVLIVFTLLYRSEIWKKILAGVCLFFVISWTLSSGTFSSEETSNKTKLEDVNNFVVHVTSNSNTLLIGDGMGSYFYRQGKGDYAKTENTVLDFIRYFGVPFTSLLFITLFFPFRFTFNERNIFIMFSFLLYVMMSLSNPTLFNSFGCISILWYWYNISLNEDN